MESTYQTDSEKKSLKDAWHLCKELFSASSPREAWQSFQCLLDALPLWLIVLLPILAFALVANSSLLIVPVGVAVTLLAIYATVRRAVVDGIKESRGV